MTLLGLTADQWFDVGISAAIVLLAVLIGRWLVAQLLDRLLMRLIRRTRTQLDDVLVETVKLPLYLLVIVGSLNIGVDRLRYLMGPWLGVVDEIFYLLYFSVLFLLVLRLVSRLFLWYGEELARRTETDLDEQLMPLARRATLVVVAIVGLSILLSHFNVEVGGLLATLGIGSLAIALAAQASLSDIFSGVVIMLDRPYRIDDRIEIQDLDTWGDVTDIGLRSTRIRTRDNRLVIIPNSVIAKSLIVNHSFPDEHYRIEVHVGVGYESDIEEARQIMVRAAQDVEGVWKDKPAEALLMALAESALLFRVRIWIESYADARRITDKVNTALYSALEGAGIDLPFPQQTIHHSVDSIDPERWKMLMGELRS